MNSKETKLFCKKYNIEPRRESGQNFLIDEKVLMQMVKLANLSKNDVVIEVGPGLGCLTRELAKKVKKVIAVEIDKKLIKILKNELSGFNNVEVIQGNALDIVNGLVKSKIVANLPYNITSHFLRKVLSMSGSNAVPMTLMLQKEVAERICAKPGEMSLLAVSVQFYAKPEIRELISKLSFWPKPEIDSAIINITPYDDNLKKLGSISEKYFFRIVKFGFSARRKQLQNNLSAGLQKDRREIQEVLERVGVPPLARAQELSIEQWIGLARELV